MSIAVGARVPPSVVSCLFIFIALPIIVRGTLLTRLALQVHKTHLEWAHVAQLSLPQLSGGS